MMDNFEDKVISELSELGVGLHFISFSLRAVIEILIAKDENLLKEYLTTLEMLTREHDKKIEEFLKNKENKDGNNTK